MGRRMPSPNSCHQTSRSEWRRAGIVCAASFSAHQVARRYVLHEPYTVAGAKELKTVTVHRCSIDGENNGGATPHTDDPRRCHICGQMHMVAAHREQANAQDRLEIACNGAMVQRGRWLHRSKLEINRHTVTLLRSNTGAALVEREALLVVASNNLLKLGAGDRKAMPGTGLKQIRNVHPATRLKLQSDPLGLVAQVLA